MVSVQVYYKILIIYSNDPNFDIEINTFIFWIVWLACHNGDI